MVTHVLTLNKHFLLPTLRPSSRLEICCLIYIIFKGEKVFSSENLPEKHYWSVCSNCLLNFAGSTDNHGRSDVIPKLSRNSPKFMYTDGKKNCHFIIFKGDFLFCQQLINCCLHSLILLLHAFCLFDVMFVTLAYFYIFYFDILLISVFSVVHVKHISFILLTTNV